MANEAIKPALTIAVRPANKISISIDGQDRQAVSIELPANEIGAVVSQLLNSARLSSEQAGIPLPHPGYGQGEVLAVQPTAVGLSLGLLPARIVLVGQFGTARVGVSLEREQAIQLVQSMTTALARPEGRA